MNEGVQHKSFMEETIAGMDAATGGLFSANEKIRAILGRMRGSDKQLQAGTNECPISETITDRIGVNLSTQNVLLNSIHNNLEELNGLI